MKKREPEDKQLCITVHNIKCSIIPLDNKANIYLWVLSSLMHTALHNSRDQKANWPKHLPELVYAYNSMRLAITGYSLHYLMFGWWPHLPINFIFPLSWAQKNTSMSTTTLLTYMSNCTKPSRKHKCSPHLRLKDRGSTMIIKLMTFHWNHATWSWLKLTPTKGGERWKTSGRRNHMKWNAGLLKVSLPTPWRTGRPDAHESSNRINFFSSPP